MVLRRFYPGLAFSSGLCFVVFVAGLGVLLFADLRGWSVQSVAALGVFAAGVAAVGAALWLAKVILEMGFHLQERIQEARGASSKGGG